jgi:hypothetical protein
MDNVTNVLCSFDKILLEQNQALEIVANKRYIFVSFFEKRHRFVAADTFYFCLQCTLTV